MNTEIELGGHQYRIGKLTAMQQFHVTRRIAPLLPNLASIFVGLQNESASTDFTHLAHLAQPFMQAIAAMNDSEAEQLIGLCLTAVKRQHAQGWQDVWNRKQNVCMFDDIDLGVMLPLVVRVITENLGGFINGLLTAPLSSPTPLAA